MFPPQLFPKLTDAGYTITSPADKSHNCIAFVVGDQIRWWWPSAGPATTSDPIVFWPPNAPISDALDAFISVFASIGFERIENMNPNADADIIAIYALDGRVKHAARQMPNGLWRSKMGKSVDIEHELTAVEGPLYGTAVAFVQRRRPVQVE